MTKTLRFIVIQSVLISGLVALWFSGHASTVIGGDSLWFVGGVLAFAALGIMALGFRRTDDARFIAEQLVIIAVIGMQIGISGGLSGLALSIAGGGELVKIGGVFMGVVAVALHVSIAALASYFWLNLNLHLLGESNDRH